MDNLFLPQPCSTVFDVCSMQMLYGCSAGKCKINASKHLAFTSHRAQGKHLAQDKCAGADNIKTAAMGYNSAMQKQAIVAAICTQYLLFELHKKITTCLTWQGFKASNVWYARET